MGLRDIDCTSLCSSLSLILQVIHLTGLVRTAGSYAAAAAARNYWHCHQPDLSQRTGTPGGFDRRIGDGSAAEGSRTEKSSHAHQWTDRLRRDTCSFSVANYKQLRNEITQAAVVLCSAATVTGALPQRHDVTQ